MGTVSVLAQSRFIAAALCAAAISTGATQQVAGRAVISGRVVDAVDGRPVANANVSISPKTGGSIGPILSDAQGRFSFPGLRANAYSVIVAAEGYLFSGESRSKGVLGVWIDVADAELSNEVVVSLERATQLSGTLYHDRQVVSGARIFVLREGRAGRALETVARIATLADGTFRFSRLEPGSYVLAVKPKVSAGAPVGFSYFANSVLASGATRVDIAAGQHLDLPPWDIEHVPGFAVSGRAVDALGSPLEVLARLVPANPSELTDISTAEVMSNSRGQFTFVDVPPGDYRIEFVTLPALAKVRGVLVPTERRGFLSGQPLAVTSNEGTLWAETSVSVIDRAVSGVALTGAPGTRLRVQLRFNGKTEPPSAEVLSAFAVYVRRIGGAVLEIPGARFESDAVATTVELPDGDYVMGLAAPIPGWSVDAVTIDSVDVLGRAFRMPSSGAILSLTDESTSLRGVVRTRNGFPAPGAVVHVVSTDKTHWTQFGFGPTRVLSVQADRDGFYNTSLLKGDYWVAGAERGAPSVSLLSEDVIGRLMAGARRVSVKPGQTAVVDLTLK